MGPALIYVARLCSMHCFGDEFAVIQRPGVGVHLQLLQSERNIDGIESAAGMVGMHLLIGGVARQGEHTQVFTIWQRQSGWGHSVSVCAAVNLSQ